MHMPCTRYAHAMHTLPSYLDVEPPAVGTQAVALVAGGTELGVQHTQGLQPQRGALWGQSRGGTVCSETPRRAAPTQGSPWSCPHAAPSSACWSCAWGPWGPPLRGTATSWHWGGCGEPHQCPQPRCVIGRGGCVCDLCPPPTRMCKVCAACRDAAVPMVRAVLRCVCAARGGVQHVGVCTRVCPPAQRCPPPHCVRTRLLRGSRVLGWSLRLLLQHLFLHHLDPHDFPPGHGGCGQAQGWGGGLRAWGLLALGVPLGGRGAKLAGAGGAHTPMAPGGL